MVLLAARVVAPATVVAGLLYVMLDSGVVSPERAPALTSVSLGGLALLFGLGTWGMSVGGQKEKSPLLAGLALGVGGYALARLLF